MTSTKIAEMEPGPEMDLLIAEKVMGFLIIEVTPPCDHVNLPYVPHIAKFSDNPLNFHFHRPLNNPEKNYNWGLWHPSADISDAWKVVEELKAEGHTIDIESRTPGWTIIIDKLHNDRIIEMRAETSSLAICRAALEMVIE